MHCAHLFVSLQQVSANRRNGACCKTSNPSLSAENIVAQIGLSKRGVEKQLKKFRDLGIITRQGSDKTGYWEIVKDDEKKCY